MEMRDYFNEDCMIGMARYPDKYFDLAIVDPPYGIGASKMTYELGKTQLAPHKAYGYKANRLRGGYSKG